MSAQRHQSQISREAETARRAMARFKRLIALAEDPEVSPRVSRQVTGEAWGAVEEVGPIRLSVARELLRISDSTIRDWIAAGKIHVAGDRPKRVALKDVVGLIVEQSESVERSSIESTKLARATEIHDWITLGTLRGQRSTLGSAQLDAGEANYARTHGDLLRLLARGAERTDADLVVLFGSAARGADTPKSDVDLLVRIPTADRRSYKDVAFEFKRLLRQPVDVIPWDAAAEEPALLMEAITDGRVIRDDLGVWSMLDVADDALQEAIRLRHSSLKRAGRSALDELKRRA